MMLKQQLSQKLLQKLSPQQIQFIKLLQLNTQDFEQKIEQELLDNPSLETAKEQEELEENELELGKEKKEEKEFSEDYDASTESVSTEELFDISEYTNSDEGGGYTYDGNNDEDKEKKEIPFAQSETFREELLQQVNAFCENDHDMILANQLVGSIEEDGYLRRPLAAIVNDLAFTMNVDTNVEELEKMLMRIQALEPAGIGARSLQECLLLQLYRKDKTKYPELTLAIKILEKHLETFTKKHYDKLKRSLKINDEQLKAAIDLITKLNPKPGDSGGTNAKLQYIVPDFLVTEDEGHLEVSLNSRNAPDLRINRDYMNTLKAYEKSENPSKELKDSVSFIKQKLDGAKWFIDSIKQRQNTLLSTMKAIVEYQHDFFITADEADLKPMILKDIAEKVSLDVSTISRVANSKYVQTDFGIISLKFFFSEGIMNEEGEEVSNREVKKILKEAIDNENKKQPLPDEKLMEILKEKGYAIARRTVAKYREQLSIPVARLRKEI